MKMTYVSPTGQKVQASDDPKNIPVVDVSGNNSSNQNSQTTSTTNQQSLNNNQSDNNQNKESYDLTKAEEFRKFIEVEVLKIIKALAEAGKTPKEKVQEIARTTLTLIQPGMTVEELYQNAVKLDDQHSELAPVVYAVMKEYEEKYEKKALNEVQNLIRQGEFEQAQELVKKVLAFKISN